MCFSSLHDVNERSESEIEKTAWNIRTVGGPPTRRFFFLSKIIKVKKVARSTLEWPPEPGCGDVLVAHTTMAPTPSRRTFNRLRKNEESSRSAMEKLALVQSNSQSSFHSRNIIHIRGRGDFSSEFFLLPLFAVMRKEKFNFIFRASGELKVFLLSHSERLGTLTSWDLSTNFNETESRKTFHQCVLIIADFSLIFRKVQIYLISRVMLGMVWGGCGLLASCFQNSSTLCFFPLRSVRNAGVDRAWEANYWKSIFISIPPLEKNIFSTFFLLLQTPIFHKSLAFLLRAFHFSRFSFLLRHTQATNKTSSTLRFLLIQVFFCFPLRFETIAMEFHFS